MYFSALFFIVDFIEEYSLYKALLIELEGGGVDGGFGNIIFFYLLHYILYYTLSLFISIPNSLSILLYSETISDIFDNKDDICLGVDFIRYDLKSK